MQNKQHCKLIYLQKVLPSMNVLAALTVEYFFYDSLNIYYISEPTVDNNKIILDLEIIVT